MILMARIFHAHSVTFRIHFAAGEERTQEHRCPWRNSRWSGRRADIVERNCTAQKSTSQKSTTTRRLLTFAVSCWFGLSGLVIICWWGRSLGAPIGGARFGKIDDGGPFFTRGLVSRIF